MNFNRITESLRRAKLLFAVSVLSITAAFSAAATVTSWGSNTYGQQVTGVSAIKAVAAGGWHSIVLKMDGTVYGQGNNADGQCNVPAGLSGVVAVSAGENHSAALKSDGTVVCWGSDNQGQIQVPAGLANVTAIALGGNNSMALLNDGTIVQWGAYRTPTSSLTNIVSIASHRGHSMAIKQDGTVTCWGGLNQYGQRNVPAGLTDVVQVAAGWYHSLALKSDGTVVAWGDNTKGQKNLTTDLTGVRSIAAGGQQSFAITDAGTIVSSGDNAAGQLTVPDGFPGASAIAAGYGFTMGCSGDVQMSSVDFVGGSTYKLKANLIDLPVASYTRVVDVTTDDPDHTGVPATFTIPANVSQASIPVSHEMVASSTPITISISGPGVVSSTSTMLEPFYVRSIFVDGNKRVGGQTFSGTAVLNAPPKAPLTLSLSSDKPLSVALPATAQVYTGNTNVSFAISTSEVAADTVASISAEAALVTPKAIGLTIYAKPQISSLKLSKTTVFGNQKLTGTITLTGKHFESDVTVTLGSSAPGVAMPASVTLPKGVLTATFDIATDDVAALTTVTITASTPFVARGVNLNIKPMLVTALSLNPSSIQGGSDSTGTVTLSGIVEVDTVVDLSVSKSGVTLPTTVTVLAGNNTADFTMTADATTVLKTRTIRAGRKGLSKGQALTINP